MSGHQEEIIEQNKAIIHKNWAEIKTQLNVTNVIDLLIEKGVVDDEWWEKKRKIKSEIEKNEELLHILTNQPSSIPIFYRVLKDTNHSLTNVLQINEDSSCSGESGTDTPACQIDDNQSPAVPVFSNPGEFVRKSDLNELYDRLAFKLDDMKFSFNEKYDLLQTKYIKLLERVSGDQSAIGEREREFEKLLKDKEDLKGELKKSNMNIEEIEKNLEDERAKHKAERESLERAMDQLKTEKKLLDEEVERQKCTAKLQQKQYEEIQRTKKQIEGSEILFKKLADKNLEIKTLEREVEILRKLLRQPKNAYNRKKKLN